MKKKIYGLLVSTFILLTACSSIKNKDAIKAINNIDHEPINLKADSVINMVKEKFSFSLLMYTESCSYCEKAKDNYKSLSNKLNYSLYMTVINEETKQYISNNIPTIFDGSEAFPSLFIFDNGSISYKASYDDLLDLNKFQKLLKAYSIDTNISTTNNLSGYKDYQSKYQEYLLFTYDTGKYNKENVYEKYLFTRASSSDKNTLIIDKNAAKPDLLSEIYKYHQTDKCIFSIIENGKIKTTLEYENQSGSLIKELLISFFGVDSVNRSS